ncbi:MAG: response regulator [Thermoanaerobaculia bacterium]|nr:response regulator [Thermoanaerobaculia bacterium]
MSKKKILLVDDSVTTLMMEQMVLRGQPYNVVTAKNGEEAVRMSEAELPDLILLDVMMPVMNGFEACRRIRQNLATLQIPIIMVTTRGEENSVETGFESGCNDYITKPINGTELLTKVRALLGE